MTYWKHMVLMLAAVAWTAAPGATAFAQQSQAGKPAPQKPAPRKPQAQAPAGKQNFDMYEPGHRQRLRREVCGDREQAFGAFCYRACKKGYEFVPGSKPPKCRSLIPLPQGQIPGPVRKEPEAKPRPPRRPPADARPPKPGLA